MDRADQLIEILKLAEHPEGGYFRETYRSEGVWTAPGGDEFPNGRAYSTAIYYLLKGDDRSKLHRVKSDELWHFYEGSAATIHVLHPGGRYEALHLGDALRKGQRFQHTVPAGCWFGVTVDDPAGYILAGCTVAPGFDFKDFEMGDREQLKQAFPEHKDIIERLT